MSNDQRPIAIIGGLGKTGRRVAERLAGLDQPLRPLSRSTSPRFDWARPADWVAALEGARAAYVTFQPDLAVPQSIEAISQVGKVAREVGLEHLVLLSGRGEDGARAAEGTLASAGIPWTVVRASWFAQNFSESFLVDAVRAGQLALPVDAVAEPFIDAEDIADVVVAALTGVVPLNRVFEVTGPKALRFQEVASIIAEATGRPLRFESISSQQFEEQLRAHGTPDEVVAMLMDLFTTTLDGRNSGIANGVQDALGRSPHPFEAYAQLTAASGVWDI